MNNYTIIKVEKIQKKDYTYRTATILHEGKAYQIDFYLTDLKDYIEEYVYEFECYLDAIYGREKWRDDMNHSEIAEELSYRWWGEEIDYDFSKYINSIELSYFDELVDYVPK